MLDGRSVPISSEFNLILHAVSRKPDFGPEISEYIIQVNFELTEAAFDAQIMAIIIQEIEKELEEKQRKYKSEAVQWIVEIKQSEV